MANLKGVKTTVYLDPQNKAYVESLDGSSDSYKINKLVTEARLAQKLDPLDGLLRFLEDLEQTGDSIYVVGLTDKNGATNKGRTSLAKLLRAYMNHAHPVVPMQQGGAA